MEEEKREDTKTSIPGEIIDKDKTFNRLREIQNLLKKESSLNELCKYNNQIISKNVILKNKPEYKYKIK